MQLLTYECGRSDPKMEAVAGPQSIRLLVDDQIQLTIEYITELLALMRDDAFAAAARLNVVDVTGQEIPARLGISASSL